MIPSLHQSKKIILILVFFFMATACCFGFKQEEGQPVVVNGDKVEYLTEKNVVTAEGNVEIIYGTTTLHCDSITANTFTKEVFAKGNVVLKEGKGGDTLKSDAAFFNLDTKLGKIIRAHMYSSPYYGSAPTMDKFPTKYVLHNATVTTCNLDKPHYHLFAREVEIRPNDKIRAKSVTFVVGSSTPILYLPSFTQSLQEKRNSFSVTPGHSREWGAYLLTAYRYYLTKDIKGFLRLDYRQNKGFAWGSDVEFKTPEFGNGAFKYYQVRERLSGFGEVEPIFKDRSRYKVEYQHQWQMTDFDSFMMNVNNYSDINFLRNYFYRQYEKDNQPRSYMLYTHTFPNATLSTLVQKRVNHFYTQLEKLPEVKLETVNQKIADTPFYYQNQSSMANLHNPNAYTDIDPDVVRADTYNKLSYPFKLSFINFGPYVGMRNSYYNRDLDGERSLYRTIFYTGTSLSTKFYRTFDADVDTPFVEIYGLRHIITPMINYDYIHPPTFPPSRIYGFDEIDTIARQNRVTLALENKLQTKRDGQAVDFLRFLVQSPYDIRLAGHGGRFQDIEMDLDMLPNSRLEFKSDAHFDLRKHAFRDGNFSTTLKLDHQTQLSTEYRYSKADNSQQLTVGFERQLTAKWHFRAYQRLEFRAGSFNDYVQEQEYGFIRDLHCWDLEFSINQRQQHGITMWFTFRLKAFPEAGFNFKSSYTPPRTQPAAQ